MLWLHAIRTHTFVYRSPKVFAGIASNCVLIENFIWPLIITKERHYVRHHRDPQHLCLRCSVPRNRRGCLRGPLPNPGRDHGPRMGAGTAAAFRSAYQAGDV